MGTPDNQGSSPEGNELPEVLKPGTWWQIGVTSVDPDSQHATSLGIWTLVRSLSLDGSGTKIYHHLKREGGDSIQRVLTKDADLCDINKFKDVLVSDEHLRGKVSFEVQGGYELRLLVMHSNPPRRPSAETEPVAVVAQEVPAPEVQAVLVEENLLKPNTPKGVDGVRMGCLGAIFSVLGR